MFTLADILPFLKSTHLECRHSNSRTILDKKILLMIADSWSMEGPGNFLNFFSPSRQNSHLSSQYVLSSLTTELFSLLVLHFYFCALIVWLRTLKKLGVVGKSNDKSTNKVYNRIEYKKIFEWSFLNSFWLYTCINIMASRVLVVGSGVIGMLLV